LVNATDTVSNMPLRRVIVHKGDSPEESGTWGRRGGGVPQWLNGNFGGHIFNVFITALPEILVVCNFFF
jgi:hypothetical protein